MLLFTERTYLRDFNSSDITEQYLGWLNDPIVTKYSNQRFSKHTHRSSEKYLNSFAEGNNLFLAICLINDNSPIGTVTVYKNINHLTADVGILIGEKKYWNRGYGTEVFNCLLSYLLESAGVRKVTAGTASINHGMINTLKKCGMHLEAVKVRQEIIDSSIVDLHYYARFARE